MQYYILDPGGHVEAVDANGVTIRLRSASFDEAARFVLARRARRVNPVFHGVYIIAPDSESADAVETAESHERRLATRVLRKSATPRRFAEVWLGFSRA